MLILETSESGATSVLLDGLHLRSGTDSGPSGLGGDVSSLLGMDDGIVSSDTEHSCSSEEFWGLDDLVLEALGDSVNNLETDTTSVAGPSETVLLSWVSGESVTLALGWTGDVNITEAVEDDTEIVASLSFSGAHSLLVSVDTAVVLHLLATTDLAGSPGVITASDLDMAVAVVSDELNVGVGVDGGVDSCSGQGEGELLALNRHLGY